MIRYQVVVEHQTTVNYSQGYFASSMVSQNSWPLGSTITTPSPLIVQSAKLYTVPSLACKTGVKALITEYSISLVVNVLGLAVFFATPLLRPCEFSLWYGGGLP